MRDSLRLILLCTLAVFASAATPLDLSPPKISDLAGNWIGQSAGGAFARLALTPEGTGILAFNYFHEQPIWLYRVDVSMPSGQPAGWRAEINAKPIGHKQTISILEAAVSTRQITIKVSNEGALSTYTLTPEIEAMSRYSKMIKNPVMRACLSDGC